jgi:hypothetical protein
MALMSVADLAFLINKGRSKLQGGSFREPPYDILFGIGSYELSLTWL